MQLARRPAALGTALVAALALAGPASASTITLHPGDSIQAAVNAAHPGDTIVLTAGKYHDAVMIQKNNITIRGAGASPAGTVVLPQKPRQGNLCGGPNHLVGFCVVGQLDEHFNVLRPTHGTRISDLVIQSFPGEGIFEYGADGSVYKRIRSQNNGGYGIFSNTSTNVTIEDNYAAGNGEAGIYVGDSPSSNAHVESNISVGNANGYLFRDAQDGFAANNVAKGNCAGFIVLDTGAPTQAARWTLQNNTSYNNRRACEGEEGEEPALSGLGIFLVGAQDVTLRHNTVYRNHATGPSAASGGIVVMSAAPFGGSAPDGANVVANMLHANSPASIVWDGSGTGVHFAGNLCKRSIPDGLCAGS